MRSDCVAQALRRATLRMARWSHKNFLNPFFGPEAAWWDHLDALRAQIKQTKQGDQSSVEAMLVTQAHALDAILVDPGRRRRTPN